MRKLLLVLALVCVPASLFAQYPYPPHPYMDNFFELSPFVGYRYGGTIYADETNLFHQNADIQSNLNYGLLFAIPIAYGWKVELAVDRQDSHFTSGNGLFAPENNMGNVDTTYYYAGMMIPFAATRSATPYFTFGGGVGNIDPHINNATSETAFMLGLGIGVKVPINRNFGIKLEERGFFTFLNGNNNNNHGCHNCYNYDYGHELSQGETNFGLYFRF